MSSRRPGYDKYYLTADCKGCGADTGVDYAYRFGESEPTVYCAPCKATRTREASAAAKVDALKKAGYVEIMCAQCGFLSRRMQVKQVGPNPKPDSQCHSCRKSDRDLARRYGQ